MTIRYVNHLGTEIDLTASPYMALGGDIMDYAWDLATVARSDGRGGRVASFRREVSQKQIPVQIWAHDADEYYAAVDALHNAFEVDVDALTPGTLYVGDSWVKAYALASAKTEWDDGADFMLNTITFAIESAWWNIETTYQFTAFETLGGSGFKYFAKYPAKYCASGGVQVINNTHFSDTPAIITIFGPANQPTFTVGANAYTVLTEIVEGERLVIDQLEMTVYKITNTGDILNEFNNRSKEPSVFEPIPSGEVSVYYSGNFPFEIKLIAQRSEPKWA